jgi:hypothetical protein
LVCCRGFTLVLRVFVIGICLYYRLLGKPERERDYLEDLGVNVAIILKLY